MSTISNERVEFYATTKPPFGYTGSDINTMARELLALRKERERAEPVADDIDTRMKEAGMLSVTEIIAGRQIDAFMRHAGVVDLESLLQWAEMRRAEFLRMQARYDIGDKPEDDMYEWVISHVAAFSELHINIRAIMSQPAKAESDTTAQQFESLAGKALVPAGWKLVPIELTKEMLKQIHPFAEATCLDCGNQVAAHCADNVTASWNDMLAVAPEPCK
ncbi:hypothetical protein SMZ63_002784 [Cronobacter sakazakii]|nr:hypothetical protein [Cronobacter sakazakii]ELY4429660.1 hypothetical protein [Cronobacter sakazakii]ELY4456210.1 hypothetical protein [Cronobacter sakazakii]ELY4597328.1 hypothetical protein [Cronobacter sakazakii]